MSRKSFLIAIVLMFLSVVILSIGGGVSLAAQNGGASIYLQGGSFNPSQGERPDLPPGLSIPGYAPGVRGYYIVQFDGPVQQVWKDAVTAEGAEVLEYIPDFAFKVRMNPAQAARVDDLGSVSWVGIFQPAYKISPAIEAERTEANASWGGSSFNTTMDTAPAPSTNARMQNKTIEYR